MRQFAQELDDSVLMQHVDLYVNDWTLDLGSTGRQALGRLSQMAQSIELPNQPKTEIEVWEG
jgi:1,4-dihydroxy-6-naphthoate synthase